SSTAASQAVLDAPRNSLTRPEGAVYSSRKGPEERMTNLRRIALVLTLTALAPIPARSQTFNLRDLLTDFVREGITLSDPPAGSPFPTHAHHFIGDASIVPLEQLNNQLAAQISTFPLASSAGGFTYLYDPALGTFTRASSSFGPIFAERAITNGLH